MRKGIQIKNTKRTKECNLHMRNEKRNTNRKHEQMQLLENLNIHHIILKMDLEDNTDRIRCTQEQVPVPGPC